MISVPFSRPIAPIQPNAEFYSIHELALFKTYTRESYRAAFGVEAPAYDPARPVKSWFDSTADMTHPDNVAVYRIVGRDQNNQWTTRQLVLSAREAATPNLTGEIRYAPYVVAPTNTLRAGSTIHPVYLSLESEARGFMAQFDGSDLGDEGESGIFPITYPADEPRRLWYFMYRGRPVNAGALLNSRNRKGMGAPGHWDVSSGEPMWIPDPPAATGADDTRPPRELPIRDLLPNEKLQATLLDVTVVRTDKQKESEQSSGRFTAEDRLMLQQIHQKLTNK
jgi:hypothetical protein